MMKKTDTARFWAKVERRGADECWPWLAGCDPKGYGKFRIGGPMRYAHRVAYEMEKGPIPEGMCACHRCDNPKCCNPSHLFIGTKADNNADMTRKGRGNIIAAVDAATANRRAKTHCPQGHLYSGANLYTAPDGSRQCRTCQRFHWRTYYYRDNKGSAP